MQRDRTMTVAQPKMRDLGHGARTPMGSVPGFDAAPTITIKANIPTVTLLKGLPTITCMPWYCFSALDMAFFVLQIIVIMRNPTAIRFKSSRDPEGICVNIIAPE